MKKARQWAWMIGVLWGSGVFSRLVAGGADPFSDPYPPLTQSVLPPRLSSSVPRPNQTQAQSQPGPSSYIPTPPIPIPSQQSPRKLSASGRTLQQSGISLLEQSLKKEADLLPPDEGVQYPDTTADWSEKDSEHSRPASPSGNDEEEIFPCDP